MADAARSVHLRFNVPLDADVVEHGIIVKTSQKGSYFCAINFCVGYIGIQELYDGKKVAIFSVWDNQKDENPPPEKQAKILHSGKETDIQRFGGEGVGLRCLCPFQWHIDEEYRFRVKSEKDKEWTTYSGYILDSKSKEWFHLASFKTITHGKLLNSCACFVEDFRRDGKSFHEKRKACFSDFSFCVNNKEKKCTEARFTADSTPVDNINAGCECGQLFLETGHDVVNKDTRLNGTACL